MEMARHQWWSEEVVITMRGVVLWVEAVEERRGIRVVTRT
jgi:hypothetical protein